MASGDAVPEPAERRAARLVLHRWLLDQTAELGRRDTQIRGGDVGDDDTVRGVHQARVACRRLRGALATFRPLVDREVTEPVRDELRWLAHALGEARDLDVAHQRLRELVATLPEELVVGPVHQRLEKAFAERRREALDTARDALASERYAALRERLDRLATAPPWTDRSEDDARDVLPPLVRRDFQRLRHRVHAVRALTEPNEQDAAVHAARRAAKRLRYAAEAVEPIWGDAATRLAAAARGFAEALGERQDAVVALPDLAALAAQAHDNGEDAFTYGVLHERERQRVDEIDDHFDDLWRATSRKRLRSWL